MHVLRMRWDEAAGDGRVFVDYDDRYLTVQTRAMLHISTSRGRSPITVNNMITIQVHSLW